MPTHMNTLRHTRTHMNTLRHTHTHTHTHTCTHTCTQTHTRTARTANHIKIVHGLEHSSYKTKSMQSEEAQKYLIEDVRVKSE